MSNENALESASVLGTALPLIHTLLYLCASPLTMTNLSSMMLMPGTRFITSDALLSCVFLICCAETPLCTTRLCLAALMSDASVFLLACAVTITSCNSNCSGSNSIASSSPAVSAVTFMVTVAYETYCILSMQVFSSDSISKYPSQSVVTPCVVPSIITVAPMRGSLVDLSVTLPLMLMAAAET